MVSRRNLAAMLIIMGVIFFLFQFSQVVRETQNDYEINQYAEYALPERAEYVQLSLDTEKDNAKSAEWESGDYILYVGEKETPIGSIVTQWTNYSKRNILLCKNLKKYSVRDYKEPEFVIIDSNYVDFERDTELFWDFVNSGVSIVFCNLPDSSVIEKDPELMRLLGISSVKEKSVTVEGLHLFGGFLLGGEVIYRPEKPSEEKRQDMDLEVPWYLTSGGTKTYMIGYMDEYFQDYQYKNDLVPAIIWRNSWGEGQVFCVNGDYMSETSGLGILSAMIYELSDYQLYPIVNAQNTLVVDFPLLANENASQIEDVYSRSTTALQMEIIWPTLISFCEKNDLKYTCLVSPKLNYADDAEPNFDVYSQYLKMFNEQAAEVGISLEHLGNYTLSEKLLVDQDYYDRQALKYTNASAFIMLEDLDEIKDALSNTRYLNNVRTVACDEDVNIPILSYLTDDITLQSLTSDTKKFFYSRDLMLKSIETALGYDNAELNIGEILWPNSKQDNWEIVYDDMSSALDTFWKPFRSFDQTTLTQSDERVRTFLNLTSDSSREGNVITLDVTGRGDKDAYFILRTHDEEIAAIEGGSFTKIEEYAYIITANTDEVKITVKEKR